MMTMLDKDYFYLKLHLFFLFLYCPIICALRSEFRIVMSATNSAQKRCSVRPYL